MWWFEKDNIGQSAAKVSFKEKCSTTKSSESYMYKYIVYKTTNLINNKIYIGVHRTNIDTDDGYIGCGLSKTHTNKFKKYAFHQAVKKYGVKNFIRETLFEFDDTESGKIQAYKKEAELVNRDFLKRRDVYNMCLGGKVPSSIYEKQVCQYELDGTFIKLWNSLAEIERELNINTSNISQACINKSYSRDYQWRYYSGNTDNIDPINTNKKVVYQFDLQGNYITYYKSLHEAYDKTKIDYKAISQVCLGKCAQAGGFYWSYKKHFDFNPKKVRKVAVACYTKEGTFIKSFTSITEAAKEYNVGISTLSQCISGRKKYCAKVRWRYFYGNTSNIESLKD